jgi:hypothetical protein
MMSWGGTCHGYHVLGSCIRLRLPERLGRRPGMQWLPRLGRRPVMSWPPRLGRRPGMSWLPRRRMGGNLSWLPYAQELHPPPGHGDTVLTTGIGLDLHWVAGMCRRPERLGQRQDMPWLPRARVASASGSWGHGGRRGRDRKWRMEGLHHGRRRRARRGGADHKTR